MGNKWNDISKVNLGTIYSGSLLPVFQIWVDVGYNISIETLSIKFSQQ